MAKKSNVLGRGFYELYNDNLLDGDNKSGQSIRLSDIEPRSDQPRKTFEREALEVLADSIAAHGVLQPILVRESIAAEGTYEIIAGERRWRAAKMAGLSEIPAAIFTGDELEAAQVALIENIQREDLNPVEEAMGYGALIDKFGLTQDQIAKQVGKSRPTITNMLRLLDLPKEVLELVRTGELQAGHARTILGLNDEENMLPLAERAVAEELSVRALENAVKRINEAAEKQEEPTEEIERLSQVKIHMKELEKRATSSLGRKVRISRSSRKKVIELTYDDDNDLEALLVSLCGNNIFND
jgi:ParB family chromosome partitioning protein